MSEITDLIPAAEWSSMAALGLSTNVEFHWYDDKSAKSPLATLTLPPPPAAAVRPPPLLQPLMSKVTPARTPSLPAAAASVSNSAPSIVSPHPSPVFSALKNGAHLIGHALSPKKKPLANGSDPAASSSGGGVGLEVSSDDENGNNGASSPVTPTVSQPTSVKKVVSALTDLGDDLADGIEGAREKTSNLQTEL